jgi:DNA-binding GntR family transcriptional regulator
MHAARKPRLNSPLAKEVHRVVHVCSAGRVPRADASLIPLSPVDALAPEVSRTEQIVQAVTQAIVEHHLKPGEKLVEQRLGDRFQVSRTVVRQALNRLAEMKLVHLEPARGAFVAAPSVQEAREVFAVRQMIEGQMLREVIARATPTDIAMLRAHIAAERAAVTRVDVPARTRLLFDFHVRLAEVLGNDVLVHWMQELVSRCALITLLYQSADDAQASSAEHADILDAIEVRDTELAVAVLTRHLDAVVHQLTQAKPNPAPTQTHTLMAKPRSGTAPASAPLTSTRRAP